MSLFCGQHLQRYYIWSDLLFFTFVCEFGVGYVLDGLPTVSEEHLKIEQQIQLIKSWNLLPDFVINIKVILDFFLSFCQHCYFSFVAWLLCSI